MLATLTLAHVCAQIAIATHLQPFLQTLPPPNTGKPIGTEVLLKFKGYVADLHSWFPYESAKVGCTFDP